MPFMLSVNYAECHKQAHYAKCCCAEFHHAECRGATQKSYLLGRVLTDNLRILGIAVRQANTEDYPWTNFS
jgi:hypothetical protein